VSDNTIWRILLDHLNTWPDKPCEILYDRFEKEPPTMRMQQLTGTVVERKYVNGSFIGLYPFALSLRIGGQDTETRLDASDKLDALTGWLNANPPDLGENRIFYKFEATTPSQSAVYEDGCEDYGVTVTMRYYEKGA
jgi:hypothetical protein